METKVLWSAIQNAIEEARFIYNEMNDKEEEKFFYEEILLKLYEAQNALPF